MSKLLEALKRVQAGELPCPTMGICANVYELMLLESYMEGSIYVIMHELAPRWPNYAGNTAYPVEGSEQLFWCPDAKRNRWNPEDDHGALRLDLLAWLIEELSK